MNENIKNDINISQIRERNISMSIALLGEPKSGKTSLLKR